MSDEANELANCPIEELSSNPRIIIEALEVLGSSANRSIETIENLIKFALELRESTEDICVRMNLDHWISKAGRAKKLPLSELPGYYRELTTQWPLSSGARWDAEKGWLW